MSEDGKPPVPKELGRLPKVYRDRLLAQLPDYARDELNGRWGLWAHIGQLPPHNDWRVWLIRAGRGFGKTRAGAEWVCQVARDIPNARIALVGASIEDVVKVMIEGPSGLVNVARPDEPGAVSERGGGGGAGERRDRPHLFRRGAGKIARAGASCGVVRRAGQVAVRGCGVGQSDARIAAGRRSAVRGDDDAQTQCAERRVMSLRDKIETGGGTADNPHLPPAFVAAMTETYGGTRIGRQELDGELLDDAEGALWPRWLIEGCRWRRRRRWCGWWWGGIRRRGWTVTLAGSWLAGWRRTAWAM